VGTVLNERVGKVEVIRDAEREHSLSSFRIGVGAEGRVIEEVHSLYLKSSVFQSVAENVSFFIDEGLTDDVKLSFNIGRVAKGRLMIFLNGELLVNKDFEALSSHFITLPKEVLVRRNVLTFKVSSPGWAFWRTNEYQLSTVQVTGKVTDVSGAESTQAFFLSDEEVSRAERIVLKFFADCDPRTAGRLTIKVNGVRVFSGVGDCGVMNTVELDTSYVNRGDNTVSFRTDSGSYLIDNVVVKVRLAEPEYPVFYFDLDDDLFTVRKERVVVCGEIDGKCPYGCDEDLDKDCCFETSGHYWCDVETEQLNDRCVSFVTEKTRDRCESGYEDEYGRPPLVGEGVCGDDTDGVCPAGCPRYYDKDCCFEMGDNYWCDDVPLGRPLSAVCKAGVEPDERSACPDGYYDESGHRLRVSESLDDEEEELLSRYRVVLTLFFPNRAPKTGVVVVNGREVGFELDASEFSKDISDYVRSGTNSLEIIPRNTMDITSVRVDVELSS